ncbi:MAG: LytTR family DNA-binding domain-containing protein [Burkholderiaceae bacterium]|nr:LytTR family DNA-binding domain-containing protein [Burkholderiaceae bacterium]
MNAPQSATNAPAATALIADDEPHLARALAAELAALWPELTIVHVARHGTEAAERIAALQPDIAFLDIRMPGLNGLEVAEGIEGATRVVFVTAYDEYAVRAFEQEAVDYVLKPVQRERLARTVQRLQAAMAAAGGGNGDGDREADDARLLAALRRLLPSGAGSAASAMSASSAAASQGPMPCGIEPLRWIRAGSGDLVHQVPVAEVLFFRADDKYTTVQTAGGVEHLIRTPIHELAQALDPKVFVQVHRSTIVNLEHLAGTRRDEASRLFLRLRGHAAELPVSRAYVHLFRAM